MAKKYNLGLDIGTASIGWAIMDDDYQLMKVKGKDAAGVRLFSEGETAAERRGFRTNRRRLKRRKWRLKLLEEIFAPHLYEVDPNFLARLKQSNISPKDDRKHYKGSLLFPDLPNGDAEYKEEFPTIYHLRYRLMTEDRKFDIREIYLALHHIVKYRGNFLYKLTVNDFEQEQVNFAAELAPVLEGIFDENIDINYQELQQILLQTDLTVNDKKAACKKLLPSGKTAIINSVIQLVLGRKANITKLLKELTGEAVEKIELDFTAEDIDLKLAELADLFDDELMEKLAGLHNIYRQLELSKIRPDGKDLSEQMIELYNEHQEQLEKYKQLCKEIDPADAKALKKYYSLYIDGHYYEKTNIKKYTKLDFEKDVKKVLKKYANNEIAQELLHLIELDQFLPKQRTNKNGVIPHQVHQLEMDKIIENQGKYYPWLLEENPNKEHRNYAKYKLDELVTFRVPYYVGPMVDTKESPNNSKFAWMVRKEAGDITPWNFEEKVDTTSSANAFIKRMTTKDNLLIGEDVLPKSSLLYQAYEVLNELNNLRVNDKPLDVELKQAIFHDLFQKQKSVSVKNIINKIHCDSEYASDTKPKVTGFANSEKMNSSLSTYYELQKIIPDALEDPKKLDDIEQIIEWLTIFEDRKIFMQKIQEITWLTGEQQKKLRDLDFKGWGRLSKKLLNGITNKQGLTIIETMWETKANFMQVSRKEAYVTAIEKHNSEVAKDNSLEELLDEAYMSPKNKKAIRQVVKVVNDIVEIMGCEPATIAIEFTRSDGKKEQSKTRKKILEKKYEKISAELIENYQELKSELDDITVINEKLYLYFTQLGRDIYTGKQIDLAELDKYQIDHIISRKLVKDDSFNNKGLTLGTINNQKGDKFAVELFKNKTAPDYLGTVGKYWNLLYEQGLISKKKLDNLYMTEEEFEMKKYGFIARQLVETSTTAKFIANLFAEKYSNTKILEIRARLVDQVRKDGNYPKIREMNDYHHAFDAYTVAIIGRYLMKNKPELAPHYVYNEFAKDNYTRKKYKSANVLAELFSEKNIQKQLDKLYSYRFLPISRELQNPSNKLYKQTIYKAGMKNSVLPKKQDLDPTIYGGYSQMVTDHLALIRKGKKYELVSILVHEKNKLVNDNNYLKLKELIATKVKGKFELLVPIIYPNQFMQNGKAIISLVGSKEYKSEQQLVMKVDRELLSKFKNNKLKDEECNDFFDEIMTSMKYMYQFSSKVSGILEKRDAFLALGVAGKHKVMKQLLTAMHASGARQDIKELSLSSFGRFTSKPEMTDETLILHRSPSGLLEHAVRLGDLKGL